MLYKSKQPTWWSRCNAQAPFSWFLRLVSFDFFHNWKYRKGWPCTSGDLVPSIRCNFMFVCQLQYWQSQPSRQQLDLIPGQGSRPADRCLLPLQSPNSAGEVLGFINPIFHFPVLGVVVIIPVSIIPIIIVIIIAIIIMPTTDALVP